MSHTLLSLSNYFKSNHIENEADISAFGCFYYNHLVFTTIEMLGFIEGTLSKAIYRVESNFMRNLS